MNGSLADDLQAVVRAVALPIPGEKAWDAFCRVGALVGHSARTIQGLFYAHPRTLSERRALELLAKGDELLRARLAAVDARRRAEDAETEALRRRLAALKERICVQGAGDGCGAGGGPAASGSGPRALCGSSASARPASRPSALAFPASATASAAGAPTGPSASRADRRACTGATW